MQHLACPVDQRRSSHLVWHGTYVNIGCLRSSFVGTPSAVLRFSWLPFDAPKSSSTLKRSNCQTQETTLKFPAFKHSLLPVVPRTPRHALFPHPAPVPVLSVTLGASTLPHHVLARSSVARHELVSWPRRVDYARPRSRLPQPETCETCNKDVERNF